MKKLIFSSKYFMLLFMLTSLVYVGCHKEEGKELASVSSESTQLRTTVTPTVENGTLKFNTLEDVFAYMEELSTQIKQLSELGDETSDLVHPAVTISDQMASTLGFSSIYKLNPKDSDGSLINPIFPIDEMNMILNNHYEVIVGNEIYVHKNVTQHFKIQSNDAINRAILRNIPPGGEIELVDLKPGIQIFNGGPKEIQAMTKDCDCGLSLELQNGVPNPSGNNAFILKHGCIGLNSGQTWTVTWTEIGGSASGTLSGTYNAAAGNPNAIVFNVPSSVKEIKVELCIFLRCNGQPLKQYCFDISKSISDNCCKKFQKIEGDPVIFQAQGFKLVTEYENGTAWESYFHKGRTSIRSLSTGKKLVSKKLEIWANAKNRSSTVIDITKNPVPCTIKQTDNDYDSCNNCKDLDVSVWAGKHVMHHKNGDVTFNYRGSRHSSFGATQITPKYCN